MKKLLLLGLITFNITTLSAQKSLDIGFATGITSYSGDLGNDEFMQSSSLNPGIAVTIRNFISPNEVSGMKYSPFNIEARVSWNRIGYDETASYEGRQGVELRNYNRGLNFRNDIFGLSTHFSYTYYPNRRLPLYKQNLALFCYVGVGIYHSNPKADLFNGSANIDNRYFFWDDGTVRDGAQSTGIGNIIKKDGKYETDLKEWYTEGQGKTDETVSNKKMYAPWTVGFPIAAGFRYGLNKAVTLSVEFGYYKFLTDYLDDVSDAYATQLQIEQRFPNDPVKQEMAAYISDPTGKGTNGYAGPQTSPIGNQNLNDSYSFICFEVAYKINWNPKKLTSWMTARY